ncbi:MAG TPA: glycine--tRNA ligase subunit beta [Rhizomicrobium sp.]|nr:glycine--tRNA ligase subunit beta [Rhizomicrobium sp.]
MPDLLLELFSEEIPARMQPGAARDLERLVVGALTDRGLLFEGIKPFAGPRRLTLAVSGLPAKQRDVREEIKGPKVDAPQAAIDGFVKKTGLTKDQLKIEKTPKGDVYLAVIERAGRDTALVLAEILPEALAKLPWPKSMRWRTGDPVRWVRPLHSIVATLDGEVVPFTFAGVTSGNTTRGHRFLSSGALTVKRFDDYEAALKKAHVILDAEDRKAIIFEGVKSAAFVHGLEMIPDEGLLNEVAGLAEYPVVLIGAIPDQFMDVPAEILQTSMRTHQKYFSLRDPKSGKLANRFALVANMIAEDGGKEIVAGNERVLRARLSDAKFFWDEDRKRSLESRIADLKGIVFHAKLGTQYERVERIAKLAAEIAVKIGADPRKAERAARLAKADLTTGVVGEFPELQGVMGRYYAIHDKEDAEVSDAVRDHYKPVGPSDNVPSNKIASSVALADKLDQLVGFFTADERPTGSSDPFALRRGCLGFLRIVTENGYRLNILEFIDGSIKSILTSEAIRPRADWSSEGVPLIDLLIGTRSMREMLVKADAIENPLVFAQQVVNFQVSRDIQREEIINYVLGETADRSSIAGFRVEQLREKTRRLLLEFFADRLKVALKEKGVRHDLIDAVFALGHEDDLVRLVARVEALQAFLKTDDGANLLAGYKRAANILKAEEKKDAKTFISEVNEGLLAALPEKNLFAALAKAKAGIAPALEKEDFASAMRQMAALRVPVDAFFDGVKVNDEDPRLRENRLNLLAALRAALHQVADFSRIEG